MNKEQIYKKLGSFKRVDNILSNKGNHISNEFVLYYENGTIFQSYKSIIAVVFNTFKSVDNPYYLGVDWDYSKTTGKYRDIFLNSNKKTIEEDLKNGVAILINDL